MTALHRLMLGGPDYPPHLAALRDAPRILYVRGRLAALAGPAVAVVGTREASPAGRAAAFAIGERLAAMGLAVASGLALGIDGEAHGGALAAGGVTFAILAHGLDRVYPPEHKTLAGEILASGGALVSELADLTRPAKVFFVRRNRVVSGLSAALVLVESKADGGAMHAARFAREQGRPVFAVWSETKGFEQGGARRAVSELGATVVRSVGELAAALGPVVERWRAGGSNNDTMARAAARKGG